jgi:hypothetical protein
MVINLTAVNVLRLRASCQQLQVAAHLVLLHVASYPNTLMRHMSYSVVKPAHIIILHVAPVPVCA